MDKRPGFKPNSKKHHHQLLASGEVTPIEVAAPKVYRHLASGDTYGEDDDGRLITGYLPLQLGRVPRYQIKSSGLRRFASSLEGAASRILAILGTPLAAISAAHIGVNIAPARLVLEALSEDSDERKALRLLDLYGPERVSAWADAVLELGEG